MTTPDPTNETPSDSDAPEVSAREEPAPNSAIKSMRNTLARRDDRIAALTDQMIQVASDSLELDGPIRLIVEKQFPRDAWDANQSPEDQVRTFLEREYGYTSASDPETQDETHPQTHGFGS